jgi:hypothetical protein
MKKPSLLSISKHYSEHEAYVLDRYDILDIGNKNIVLYRIEIMPAIHRPNHDVYKLECTLYQKAFM